MSYYRIFTTAFAQTVMNSAFSKEVEYSGYKVPAAAIDRAILPAFTDENGKFSKKLYNQISDADLNTMRLNSEKNLVYSRYVDDLFGTGATEFNGKPLYGLKSAAAEESFISSLGEEKHSFNMVTFDTGDYPKEEAVKFGKENSDKFIKYSLSAITAETESEAKAILKQIQNTEITFESGYAYEDIKEYINQAVEEYFLEVREKWEKNDNLVVRILQVERAIVDVTGVEDVAGTTLNGAAKNYTVGKNKLPVKGELTCTSK